MARPVPSNKKLLAQYEDKSFIGKIVSETLVAYKQPKVKSNAELAQRLSDYFTFCAQNNVIPTVEEMCLYTGLNLTTAEIIKKAKAFMRVFDAKLVVSGKMNPVTYIFRAKNYYGMTDKQEVEVTKTNQLGDNLTDDELAKKLMKETEVIDVETSEAEE